MYPMSEHVMRFEGAPRPIDLATLSRPARSLLKVLSAYPSWSTEGWANPSDEDLRDDAEYRDTRPIQRARRSLVDRGLVEYHAVRRGELLPNGERARFRQWIYVMGPGLRPTAPSGGDGGGELVSKPAEARCETLTQPPMSSSPRCGISRGPFVGAQVSHAAPCERVSNTSRVSRPIR